MRHLPRVLQLSSRCAYEASELVQSEYSVVLAIVCIVVASKSPLGGRWLTVRIR